ncbi:hypothetical protein GCM10028801_45580 [Nocardioides maradonensis]
MAETFQEYAARRAKTASATEKAAVEAFDATYATYGVGAALAVARKAVHLKQGEVAKLAGLDQGDISRIERGLVAPTASTLLKIVGALGAELTLTVPIPAGELKDDGVESLHLAMR